MTWKLVFKIYAAETEKKLELTRYKLNNISNVKTFLTQFFEDQREWIHQEKQRGKGIGYEIVLVDEKGEDLSVKNLYELLHAQEDLVSFFSLTTDAIGELLAEGIS
ncbi:hypothetical protein EU534_02180 [Candidatus Heimdallarchaeota archaeon]|nr:MAG: hypothetical protein EU534_02180 [Candidatus Heimdallarchaeota archaeon]